MAHRPAPPSAGILSRQFSKNPRLLRSPLGIFLPQTLPPSPSRRDGPGRGLEQAWADLVQLITAAACSDISHRWAPPCPAVCRSPYRPLSGPGQTWTAMSIPGSIPALVPGLPTPALPRPPDPAQRRRDASDLAAAHNLPPANTSLRKPRQSVAASFCGPSLPAVDRGGLPGWGCPWGCGGNTLSALLLADVAVPLCSGGAQLGTASFPF